jgi:hypothetical protein
VLKDPISFGMTCSSIEPMRGHCLAGLVFYNWRNHVADLGAEILRRDGLAIRWHTCDLRYATADFMVKKSVAAVAPIGRGLFEKTSD